MEAFRLTRAASVRGAMAAHLIGIDGSAALGDIVLHPHQVDAVRRLARMLAERRGALLADDVGLGKTYVALAVAREWASPLIVVPAALRASWHAAMAQTGVRAMTCSIESLSYSLARFEPDLVIIDEAHHLRNSATKRFASAATLCQRAHVLLMTATPVQNRLDDLRALLSLFLGRHAYALTDGELAAHCVRRSAEDVPSELLRLPRIQAPAWLPRVADADCLERILALPPPFATSDGSDGGVLTTYTLVRQWSSSRAALSGGIRRRIGRGLALESALEADRFPSRRELQAWVCADGDVQLAFAELVAPAIASDAGALLGQVHDHLDALREFLAWIDASADADVARAAVLRDLMARHPGERVVAFSAYGDTVRRLYALLSPDIRSAMLTHSSGKVSGGPISRRELLERFDPSLAKRVPASDHVHLLLATDVCSEGVSLHAASVVVHLDLAWNPARLAQRVGRLRRIGAPRECVSVYLAPPPASAARMLQIETVLHRKLMAAASSVGVPDAVLPELQPDARGVALDREERIASWLARWRGDEHCDGHIVAAVHAPRAPCTALACVRTADGVTLLAVDTRTRSATADRVPVERALTAAEGDDADVPAPLLDDVACIVRDWARAKSAAGIIAPAALTAARARVGVLRRVNAIARKHGRHAQAPLAPLITAARVAATAPLSAGAERALDTISRDDQDDEVVLARIIGITSHQRATQDPAELLVVLLLLP